MKPKTSAEICVKRKALLRDNGELKTRFGTYLLAAGGIGEFGPILLVTLVLSTSSALHESLMHSERSTADALRLLFG